jgi:MOSC domain-containing protein YiiM
MTASLLSLNVGRPTSNAAQGEAPRTGIIKTPVESAVLRAPGPKHGGLGSGVEGDFLGDTHHHGGDTQAVYAFAREELDWWGERLGRDLPDGMFGENLTTVGLEVDTAEVGERWRVGETLLEVCGPRIPCATFAKHMAERAWVRRFAERGLTGAYLAVVEPGAIGPGDPVEVVHRPGHGLRLPAYFRALMGDRDLAATFLASGLLPQVEHDWLARRQ